MHGLVNRSLQCFLRDTYGAPLWDRLAEGVGVGPQGFEAMLVYDDGLTDANHKMLTDAGIDVIIARSAGDAP